MISNIKLGDVLELIRNGIVSDQNDEDRGYPVTRIETISAGKINPQRVKFVELSAHDFEKYRLKEGDILFSHINSVEHIGKVGIYEGEPGNLVHGMNLLLFRPQKDKINPRYLNYVLKTNPIRRHFQTRCKKAVNQASLNQEDIKSVTIPVPSLKVQEKIINVLMKAESALEKRRQTLRLADEFLKSAFLEMFGEPARNQKKFKVVPCGEIASHVSSGSTPLGGDKTYLKEGILFIRSQNVLMNRLDLSDVAYISSEVHQRMNRTWVKKNDVLLNITGASIGRVSFFEGEDDTANVNQHVCIIRPVKTKILPQYLSFLISMPNYQKIILGKNAGATRQAFNFDQIKRFQIPLPAIPEQQKFAELVQKVEKLKEKQKQSETQLQNLFNSLMQGAFKGELK